MKCATCSGDNEPDSAFCEHCGGRLVATCTACGAELKPAARFCRMCGTAVPGAAKVEAPAARRVADYTPKHLAEKILQSRNALEGERKQITVLFADIQDSMRLAALLDPEAWHQLLDAYFAILTEAVHRFEGTVNQYTGDGIMALFGAPIAHEDHAQRACYAALAARDRLRSFAETLRLPAPQGFQFRLGLNSGEVVVGKIGDDLRMDYTAQGTTVGIAQRIEQAARPGSAYVGDTTARLVAGYFRLQPRGALETAPGFAATSVFELETPSGARTRLDVAASRGLSRFVGRAAEMGALEAALERAAAGHGQVIGIVGEPGLGKSRLCLEFVERCRERGFPIYEARCPAHGKNIPFLPILELFRSYFAIEAEDDAESVRTRIAEALLGLDAAFEANLPVLFEFMGVSDPERPLPPMEAEIKQRQLYDLMHRVVRAGDAAQRVSMTLIDDLHWIDAGSDGFVHQLVNAVASTRNVLVLNFRPEYTAAFFGKPHYQQLPLVPLSALPLQEMIEDLIGRDPSVAALAPRIVQWTGGNPFYTEELILSLVEDGNLRGTPGQYRLDTALDQLTVPANVRAVLAARIDRLPESAKRLLQTAAVIGREFNDPLLAAVSDLPPSDYSLALERLKAGDFIHERSIYPVFEYAFKHALTQEVAYGSQLQTRRAIVHAATARALETQGGARLDELAALLARHWELAGDILAAARWHRRAAEWTGLSDLQAALHHWLRIRTLVRALEGDAEAAALTVTACSRALMFGWRLGEATEQWSAVYEEGCAAAERGGDLRALSSLHAMYSAIRGLSSGSADEYVRYAAQAVEIADRTPDRGLQCAGRALLVYALWYRGEMAHCESVADDLVALAGGDADLGAASIGLSPLAAALQTRSYIIALTRDPELGLAEAKQVRQFAIDRGYRDMAGWIAVVEGEIRYALRDAEGIRVVAREALALAKERGAAMEVMAACTACNAHALQADWAPLLQTANEALALIRRTGTLGLWQQNFLAHRGVAELGRGDALAARAAAYEAVEFMRGANCRWNPQGYGVLARAQLALQEPCADIARTLDEYADVLHVTGLRLLEGELHELRARVADREGRAAARREALSLARACYARFGMRGEAARLAAD